LAETLNFIYHELDALTYVMPMNFMIQIGKKLFATCWMVGERAEMPKP